jgi:hypothetical protein
VAGSIDVPATFFALAGLGAWPEGGRDLSAPAPRDGGAAFGMRNLFSPAGRDRRSDGRVLAVSGARFYAALPEGLFAGDAQALWVDDGERAPAPPELRLRLAPLFAGFARELAALRPAQALDATSREALRALGYE